MVKEFRQGKFSGWWTLYFKIWMHVSNKILNKIIPAWFLTINHSLFYCNNSVSFGSIFMLEFTCVGVRFGINYLSACLNNFKIFENHEGDLSKYLSEPNIWLLVNHTKSTNTFYWDQYFLIAGKYKLVNGELQNSRKLWNSTVNGVMSITINDMV